MKKQALITGGTHGIGESIANELINKGISSQICARGIYPTDKHFIKCDVTSDEDLKKLFELVPDVDIIVCNSGGGGRWGNPVWHETDFSVWQEVYDKNVNYIIKLMNHYLPKMIEKKWGRIIVISSILGKESSDDGRPWFQIAKSAQISLMKAYSKNKHYVRNNITFNTISPGAIMIPDTGWEKMYKENINEYTKFVASLPMGRLGHTNDVSNIVTFLCKHESNYINGANIVVDGGQSYSF